MTKYIHAIYLSIVGILLVAIGLLLGSWPSDVLEEEHIPRMVVVPFFASQSIPRMVSLRLMDELLQELNESPELTVVPPVELSPHERDPREYRNWFEVQNGALVLTGSVSGSEENLRISAELIDSRSMEQVWENSFVTNIYDLAYVREKIAHDVVSLAGRYGRQ